MDRLPRFRLGDRFKRYFRQKKVEYKKDYKDFAYDIKHVQKKTLLRVYNIIVGTSSLGLMFAYLAYNTFYRDKQLAKITLKANDKPLPLNDNLELLAIREWNTAHVSRSYKLLGLLSFFPCKGSDILSIGDLRTRTGLIIGLPHNFTYNTIDDVKPKEVMIFGKTMKEESVSSLKEESMKNLIESLVLSENAKRFAIAREIHFADNYRVFTEAGNIFISTMGAVGGGQQIILSMNIRRKYFLSLLFRLSSLVLGLGVWFLIRQSYMYGWNTTADESTLEQGDDYREGAVEYYQKLIQRNVALYQLLGSEGRKRYTKDGEPKGLFTSTVPSLKKRLQKIIELNEESKEEKNKTDSDNRDDSESFKS